jgi:mannose-6-phosphate isomerase-like protein (cupin superfamily)
MSRYLPQKFNKPWGHEFRFDLSNEVTLTYLTILPGCKTSLHCHPTKTTSLTAITGSGSLQFLKDSQTFGAGSSIMVRNGLFHQVINAGSQNLSVLEFENPSNAQDLVRLEDEYGRKNLGYEANVNEPELTETEKSFFDFISAGEKWENSETRLEMKFPAEAKLTPEHLAVYAVISGGLEDTLTKSLVLRPGDCTTGSTIERLITNFNWTSESKLLMILKNNASL